MLAPVDQNTRTKKLAEFQRLEKKPYIVRRDKEQLEALYEGFLENDESVMIAQGYMVTHCYGISIFTAVSDFGSSELYDAPTFKATLTVPFLYNDIKMATLSANSDTVMDVWYYAMFKLWDYVTNPEKWGLYHPNPQKKRARW